MVRKMFGFIVGICIISGSVLSAMLPMPQTKRIDRVMKDRNLSPLMGCLCLRGSMIHHLIRFGDDSNADVALAKMFFLANADESIEYAPRGHMIANYMAIPCLARIMAHILFSADTPVDRNALVASIKNEINQSIDQLGKDKVIELFRQALIEQQHHFEEVIAQLKAKFVSLQKQEVPHQLSLDEITRMSIKTDREYADIVKILDPAAGLGEQIEDCDEQIKKIDAEITALKEKEQAAPRPKNVKRNFTPEDKIAAQVLNKLINSIKDLEKRKQARLNERSELIQRQTNPEPEKILNAEFNKRVTSMAQKIVNAVFFCRDPEKQLFRFDHAAIWIILAAVWAQVREKNDVKIYFDTLREALGDKARAYMNPLTRRFLTRTYTSKEFNKMITHPEKFLHKLGHTIWMVLGSAGRLQAKDCPFDDLVVLPDNFDMASGVHFQGKIFPDCGENTIRKLFHSLLWDSKTKRFDVQIIAAAQNKTFSYKGKTYTINIKPEILSFFTQYPQEINIIDSETVRIGDKKMHDLWAEVISGLPETGDHGVFYKSHTMDRRGCNFSGGLRTLENVLFHVTGVDSLSAFMHYFGWVEEPGSDAQIYNRGPLSLRITATSRHFDIQYHLPQNMYPQLMNLIIGLLKTDFQKNPFLILVLAQLPGSSKYLNLVDTDYHYLALLNYIDASDRCLWRANKLQLLAEEAKTFHAVKEYISKVYASLPTDSLVKQINFWEDFFDDQHAPPLTDHMRNVLFSALVPHIKKLSGDGTLGYLNTYLGWLANHPEKINDEQRSLFVELYATLPIFKEHEQKVFWEYFFKLPPALSIELLSSLEPYVIKLQEDASTAYLIKQCNWFSTDENSIYDPIHQRLIVALYRKLPNSSGAQQEFWSVFFSMPTNVQNQLLSVLESDIKKSVNAAAYHCALAELRCLKNPMEQLTEIHERLIQQLHQNMLNASFATDFSRDSVFKKFWEAIFVLPEPTRNQVLKIVLPTIERCKNNLHRTPQETAFLKWYSKVFGGGTI